ncbi:MAG TPA: right-handed parallel beta-helix repeat-containing protein [Planctomycetota bacterium]|nr:right-handed parallel beta-helix repeat-containing protein [Planctomycetota bacterium]
MSSCTRVAALALAVGLGACAPTLKEAAMPTKGTVLYVATDGNDGWSGTLGTPNRAKADGPFATLERARDEIRKRKAVGQLQGGATVLVRGGLHCLPQTLKLGKDDSGTSEAPIVYRACGGERPILAGGKEIKGFVPHKGEVLKADAAAQGFKGITFRQLIFDGQRQHLARYPNFDPQNPYGGGWAYADGKPVPMYAEVPGEDRRTLLYKAADARTWSRPEEGEVFVFPRYNWWNNIVRIASVDPEKRLITLAGDCSYPIRPTDRYYVRGLFEELDAPGEWYLDSQAGTLYFWPPAPLEGKAVYAPTMRTIVEMSGVEHVTLQGFTIECCEGNAVVLKDCSGCLVAANTIRNVGDYNGSGVVVDGGGRNGVVGNDIYEVGRSAVSLSGGDRITLAPAENYADNNYLHHFGVYYKQGVGVALTGCGNRASHNLMHDGPRFGILFSGNNLVIEYNHIRHVDLETADTGAVYTGGRDWISSRGTVIRYNFFHDILGYGQERGKWISPHYCWGVYLDDNTGGVDVVGNVVARCVRGLVHLHNGRDNLIENNVLIDGRLQQFECNGWTDKHRYWTSHLPTMIKGYESVATQPAWKAMRHMDIHPKDAVLPNGMIMANNVFRRNILCYRDPNAKLFALRTVPYEKHQSDYNLVWHFGQPIRVGQLPGGKKVEPAEEWAAWQGLGFDKHSLVADPLFVDAARDDYRLRPESPAFQLGFQPIPFDKIGPYKSPLRASWPIVEAEGAREKPLVGGH